MSKDLQRLHSTNNSGPELLNDSIRVLSGRCFTTKITGDGLALSNRLEKYLVNYMCYTSSRYVPRARPSRSSEHTPASPYVWYKVRGLLIWTRTSRIPQHHERREQ